MLQMNAGNLSGYAWGVSASGGVSDCRGVCCKEGVYRTAEVYCRVDVYNTCQLQERFVQE